MFQRHSTSTYSLGFVRHPVLKNLASPPSGAHQKKYERVITISCRARGVSAIVFRRTVIAFYVLYARRRSSPEARGLSGGRGGTGERGAAVYANGFRSSPFYPPQPRHGGIRGPFLDP